MKSPRWNEVTAIFGGAFDPPHVGHTRAIEGLLLRPGVQQVVILPSGRPPLKTGVLTQPNHRLEMTRLAFSGVPRTLIYEGEMRRSERSTEPSYTYDTLKELGPVYGELAFVIGLDQLSQLEKWHRFPEVLELSHWIILMRKSEETRPAGSELEYERVIRRLQGSGVLKPGPSATQWVTREQNRSFSIIETDAPALSSTRLRESMAKEGKIPAGTLSARVSDYIRAHGLYGIQRA